MKPETLTAPPAAQPDAAPAATHNEEFEVEPNGLGHTIATLTVIIAPFIALLVAIVLLWERAVHTTDLVLMFVMYVGTGLGITVGFHRMLTHRSFQAKPWVRGFLTVAGALAVEGSPTSWVADHRRHHAFADEEGDPHSPHVGFAKNFWGVIKGFWHAHIGWLITEGSSSVKRYCPDLLKDKIVMRVDKAFPWMIVATLVVPALLGLLITGSWWGALTAFVWAGGVRMFLTHHVTWSINSICHMIGRRPFNSQKSDKSTNNWLLALPTFGEAWHHNHHTFPLSAFHGLRRWQKALDPSGWVIWTLEKLGLAWDVKRISPAQLEAKMKPPTPGDTPAGA